MLMHDCDDAELTGGENRHSSYALIIHYGPAGLEAVDIECKPNFNLIHISADI
jgi:hypothetical protein